ncbi:MAG: response regulator transcription factor [Nitrospirae bacterium]|nr:response regulator transcription factor [Nitrospirota bacterium]
MTASPKDSILIVEDDRKTASILSLYLQKEGFQTFEAYNGIDALSLFKKCRPVFVLLDLMIPKLDGIEVCKKIRQESDVPIMMVTAKVEEIDKLVGLSIGADDYVVKPFSPREIVARVKVILRRFQRRGAGSLKTFSFQGLAVDSEKHKVTLNSVPLQLTHVEFKLLVTLLAVPGRVYSREALLEEIYPGGEATVLDRTVDVHIKNLRQKIEKNPARPRYIKTVRGIGYQFAEE